MPGEIIPFTEKRQSISGSFKEAERALNLVSYTVLLTPLAGAVRTVMGVGQSLAALVEIVHKIVQQIRNNRKDLTAGKKLEDVIHIKAEVEVAFHGLLNLIRGLWEMALPFVAAIGCIIYDIFVGRWQYVKEQPGKITIPDLSTSGWIKEKVKQWTEPSKKVLQANTLSDWLDKVSRQRKEFSNEYFCYTPKEEGQLEEQKTRKGATQVVKGAGKILEGGVKKGFTDMGKGFGNIIKGAVGTVTNALEDAVN